MLNRKLIAKTAPKSCAENIVLWENYRVTVLGPQLFRLERSENRRFRDCATQAVWFRNMPKQKFRVEHTDGRAVISTPQCKLILAKDRGHVCVELDKKRVYADNFGNLLGTYRTLDACNGDMFCRRWIEDEKPTKIKLGTGVCSKTGVAVLADDSLCLGKDGEVKNERADGTDEYIFAFGKDYRGAVRALYALTGKPPLVPRFALGNWWSRYHVYTDEEYLRVLEKFEERGVPLSVATVDMDWHLSDETQMKAWLLSQGKYAEKYIGTPQVNVGWTGYSWNKELFPKPKKFLQKIKDKGLKITLNLHPSDGVRFWEDSYQKFANAMGRDASSEEAIPFSFTDSRFINAYFELLHRPLQKQGVDFWWIDWQQKNIPWGDRTKNTEYNEKNADTDGTQSADYDPLWALNHYHYLDNAAGRKTPLVLSRYAGIGSHRYPLGFSGDTEITWETLAFLPYFTATASNVGYTWWSHDIGGHNFGDKNDELYLRHIQYGVFSPINRLHCACDQTMTKEPWFYGGAGYIAQDFLRFRHALAPYLYTAAYRTANEGKPLVEPLYYAWDCPQAYEYKTQYLFGESLLVAPVVTQAEEDGYARVKAWLPQGVWTDIFTGDEYTAEKGGREFTLYRDLESIPVFIKEGGILPISLDKGNGCANPARLEVWSYIGKGEYTLYEDGREEDKDGVFETKLTADFKEKAGAGTQSLTIVGHGDGSVIPQNRTLSIRFKNIEDGEVTLYVDGKKQRIEKWITDCAAVKFDFEPNKIYRIIVNFAVRSKLEKLKACAERELTVLAFSNPEKQAAYVALNNTKSVAEFKQILEGLDLPEIAKLRILETE